jgi:hypothetical protein
MIVRPMNNPEKLNQGLDAKLYSLLSPEQISLLEKFEQSRRFVNSEHAKDWSLISHSIQDA